MWRPQVKLIQKYTLFSDYDIQQLTLQEWVTVAYENKYYVGQIEKWTTKKVTVNFSTEADGEIKRI